MKFSVLSSGSKANSTYLEVGKTRLLIDCGLSARQAGLRLGALGVEVGSLDAILVTHEHSDHIAGVPVLSRRVRLPVVTAKETAQEIPDAHGYDYIEPGMTFTIGDATIHPFSISHDAVNPVGFSIEGEGFRFVQATDLGKVTPVVAHALQGAHALVLEANHDKELLWGCDYPWPLKQRIASSHGHLSNAAMADALAACVHDELAVVVLAHLSENSNTPDHAIAAGTRALGASRATLTHGTVHASTALFAIEAGLERMVQGG